VIEEELDHVALAMVWRWFMGENNQLHRSIRGGRLNADLYGAKTFLICSGVGSYNSLIKGGGWGW
jgi:hypothetical protein